MIRKPRKPSGLLGQWWDDFGDFVYWILLPYGKTLVSTCLDLTVKIRISQRIPQCAFQFLVKQISQQTFKKTRVNVYVYIHRFLNKIKPEILVCNRNELNKSVIKNTLEIVNEYNYSRSVVTNDRRWTRKIKFGSRVKRRVHSKWKMDRF